MFFLIRYQSIVATRRDINLARQFSSVSLVHRTETNIARQFFEVRLFIIAVQQNFRDALTKRRSGNCAQFTADGKLEIAVLADRIASRRNSSGRSLPLSNREKN